ncbi:MAG: DUF3352 domain-containing protein [Anaerolineae bacterium]|nr:DUF3352 domain-containing protein [Anaerolineae bacterium]
MRRYTLFFIMILLISLGLSPTYAHTSQATPENAFFADQMPAGADIFIGIRTDEAYFDQLDDIVTTVLNGFNTIFPHMLDEISEARLYTLLERQLFFLGSFQADIRPWLGDKIGVGIYWGETAPQHTLIIIDHTNREQTESYVNKLTGGTIASATQGDFTVYGEDEALILAVNDEALYIATTSELLPINGNPTDNMATDGQFQTALATLPLPNYNLIAMGQTQYIANLLNNPTLIQLSQGLADAYTAIGATIQDDVSLTVDIAQMGLDGINTYLDTPINPDFAQHIPINTTGFIHGANFAPVINTLLSTLSASGQAPTPNDLNVLNALAGVDLTDLFLSGDFALYFGYYPDNWMAYSLEQLETREAVYG